MAYANGQIPSSARSSLQTAPGQQLVGAAARQWDALAQSVANTYGWMPALTDSYRPYSVQEQIFLQRYDNRWRSGLTTRNGGVKYWRGKTWYKKPGVSVAATPGTSNHGWGKAVDVSGLGGFNGTRYKQLAALAARFGYSNAAGRAINEPWHWEFTGAFTVSNPIGGGSVTIPNSPGRIPAAPKEWLDMVDEATLRRIVREEAAQGLLVASKNTTVATIRNAVFDHQIKDESDGKQKKFETYIAYLNKGFSGSRQIVIDALREDIAKSGGGDPAEIAEAVCEAFGDDLAAQVANELANRLKG